MHTSFILIIYRHVPFSHQTYVSVQVNKKSMDLLKINLDEKKKNSHVNIVIYLAKYKYSFDFEEHWRKQN